jgi:type IV pilus biogenesis protein CpaD/CtpE
MALTAAASASKANPTKMVGNRSHTVGDTHQAVKAGSKYRLPDGNAISAAFTSELNGKAHTAHTLPPR